MISHLTTLSTSSFLLHCPSTLLCQSYRGLEWAWSSSDASESILGASRLQFPPTLYCRAGVDLKSSTSTPSFTHGSSHLFLLSSCHLTSSSSPRSGYHALTSLSLPKEPSLDLIPKFTPNRPQDGSVVTQIPKSCVHDLWKANGELYILFPHAFLGGSTRGLGPDFTRATVNAIPLQHQTCDHYMRNVLVCSPKKRAANAPRLATTGKPRLL